MFESLDSATDSPEEPKDSDDSGYSSALAALGVLGFFAWLGKFDTGLSVAICICSNLIACSFYKQYRRRAWFWAVIAVAFVVELLLSLMIPWGKFTVNRITLLPIGMACLCLSVGAVKIGSAIEHRLHLQDDDKT